MHVRLGLRAKISYIFAVPMSRYSVFLTSTYYQIESVHAPNRFAPLAFRPAGKISVATDT